MPLIHVYMNEGKDAAYKRAISDGLHEALLETWNIPEKDRFQIFHETKQTDLQIDKEMWDVARSDDVVVFHVFTSPRSTEMKLNLYERLPIILNEKAGLRPEDVFVSLASNTRDDWSFGNGKAQLLEVPSTSTTPSTVAATSADVLSRAMRDAPPTSGLSSRAPLSLASAGRRSLTSLAAAPRSGGPAIGRLGLVMACGASAFIGTLASQRVGSATASSTKGTSA